MGNELLIDLGMRIKGNLVEEKAARFDEEYSYLLHERDTSDVWRQFATWLLVGPDDGVIRFTKRSTPQYNAIQQVAQLYIEDCKDRKRWEAAKDAAWSAAKAAYADAAAEAAYYAAAAAYAAANAAAAAWSAAEAADYAAAYADATAAAAWSVATAYAAKYATYAAYAAYAASAAADAYAVAAKAASAAADAAAAADAHYERMADKLIELIKAAPMMKETV